MFFITLIGIFYQRAKNTWSFVIEHCYVHIYSRYKTQKCKDKDKDKDSFIGPQEFVVGYSKAPKQPQSSTRPVCYFLTMTSTGREPAMPRYALLHIGARHATHCATGHDDLTVENALNK